MPQSSTRCYYNHMLHPKGTYTRIGETSMEPVCRSGELLEMIVISKVRPETQRGKRWPKTGRRRSCCDQAVALIDLTMNVMGMLRQLSKRRRDKTIFGPSGRLNSGSGLTLPSSIISGTHNDV
jgi:hypothetical protein